MAVWVLRAWQLRMSSGPAQCGKQERRRTDSAWKVQRGVAAAHCSCTEAVMYYAGLRLVLAACVVADPDASGSAFGIGCSAHTQPPGLAQLAGLVPRALDQLRPLVKLDRLFLRSKLHLVL